MASPILDSTINDILKTKKNNRRCHMHSLDSHKRRSLSDWLPAWEALSDEECKKQALIIETPKLLVTMNDYLNKHKYE